MRSLFRAPVVSLFLLPLLACVADDDSPQELSSTAAAWTVNDGAFVACGPSGNVWVRESSGTANVANFDSSRRMLRPTSVIWKSIAIFPSSPAPAPTTTQYVYLTFNFSSGSPVTCAYGGSGASLPMQYCSTPTRVSSDGAFERPVSSITATWTQGPTPNPAINRRSGYEAIFAQDVRDGDPCTEDRCSGGNIYHQSLGTWNGCTGTVCSIAPNGAPQFTDTTSTSAACTPTTTPAPPPTELFPSKAAEVAAAVTAQGGTPFNALHGSMLSGRVVDAAGGAAGVTVSAIGRDGAPGTTAGTTTTDANGWYRFAIEGGEPVTLKFVKAGNAKVLRVVETRWGSRERVPDVVLTPLELPTTIALGSSATSSWQSINAEKTHGIAGAVGNKPRRARLLIPPGTTILNAPSLLTAELRMTEMTDGPKGAMPLDLPNSIAFTYATNFSIDGLSSVQWSQPVYAYVDNFLDAPVGTEVPVGYVDEEAGRWASELRQRTAGCAQVAPGLLPRVVKVISITAGAAEIDTDGDNIADNGSKLDTSPTPTFQFSLGERQRVAQWATAGQTFWRVPMTHFSDYDFNWAQEPPTDASPPAGDEPSPDEPTKCTSEKSGSIIECENQVLAEEFPVAGSNARLRYQTDRSARGFARSVKVPLVGTSYPTSLTSIATRLTVGGQSVDYSYAPSANLFANYFWNGTDASGRPVRGSSDAYIRIAYQYPPRIISGPFFRGGVSNGVTVAMAPREDLFEYSTTKVVRIPGFDNDGFGLGGLSLTDLHAFDPDDQRLYRGDGTRVDSQTALGYRIENFAGAHAGGYTAPPADGASAENYPFFTAKSIAGRRDGAVLVAGSDGSSGYVAAVTPDKIFHRIAGFGTNAPVDGGQALGTSLKPTFVSVGNDGSLLVVESSSSVARIWRILADGTLKLLAGTGAPASNPATMFSQVGNECVGSAVTLSAPQEVRERTDGVVFFTDDAFGLFQIHRDGRVRRVAGSATTERWSHLDVRPDGDIEVWRDNVPNAYSDATGVLRPLLLQAGSTVGRSPTYFLNSAGGSVYPPNTSLWVGRTLHIATDYGRVLTWQEGVLNQSAAYKLIGGSGTGTSYGGLATKVAMHAISAAAAPDGRSLYVLNGGTGPTGYNTIDRLVPSTPTVGGLSQTLGEHWLPSADSSEVYVFDDGGRHIRTMSARTGRVLRRFEYEPSSTKLAKMYEVDDGGAETLALDVVRSGNTITMTARHGQVTTLTVDGEGRATTVQVGNSAPSLTYQLGYNALGLLASHIAPGGAVHTFNYDGYGRLTQDVQPGVEKQSLERDPWSSSASGLRRDVRHKTVLGRTSSYTVGTDRTGLEYSKAIEPGGAYVETTRDPSAGTTTKAYGNLETTTTTFVPEEQFGDLKNSRLYSVDQNTVTTVGGASLVHTYTRFLRSLSVNPADRLDVVSDVRTTLQNAANCAAGALCSPMQQSSVSYTKATGAVVSTSFAGRTRSSTIDGRDRVVQTVTPLPQGGNAIIDFTYNSEDQPLTATQGSRVQSFTYGSDGQLASMTMSGGGVSLTRAFTRDMLGRVTTETLPTDGTLGPRATTFTYDSAGNVQTLTAPGSNPNTYSYDALNRLASFQAAGPGAGLWTYAYNADGQLSQFTTPAPYRMIERRYDVTSGFLIGLTDYFGNSLGNYGVDVWGRRTSESHSSLAQTRTFIGKYQTAQQFSQSGVSYANQALTYDQHGVVSAVNWSWLGGRTLGVAYTRDADDAVTAVQAAGSTIAIARGPRREVTAQTGATITESQTFDTYGALAAIGYTNTSGGASRYTEVLGVDGVARVVTRTESGFTAATSTYTYDGAGHLSTETRNGATATYTYDPNGNRLSDGVATLTYTSAADDRLLTRTTASGTTNYTYDGEGRVASKTGLNAATYTHHDLGPMSQVTLGGVTITYTIDAAARRADRKVNGTTTARYLYADGIHPTAELDASFNVRRVFLYTAHDYVPDFVAVPGPSNTWTLQRVITDHLGSVVALVDATGTALFTRSYDAWGNMTTLSGATASDGFVFGFAGGLWDPTTKLVQFGARTYDPEIGRWLERDPSLHAGGVNLYEYAEGDPVNRVDPTGQVSRRCFLAIARGCAEGCAAAKIGKDACTAACIVLAVTDPAGGYCPDEDTRKIVKQACTTECIQEVMMCPTNPPTGNDWALQICIGGCMARHGF